MGNRKLLSDCTEIEIISELIERGKTESTTITLHELKGRIARDMQIIGAIVKRHAGYSSLVIVGSRIEMSWPIFGIPEPIIRRLAELDWGEKEIKRPTKQERKANRAEYVLDRVPSRKKRSTRKRK